METTATPHRNSIELAKYTVGFRNYKKVEAKKRVKMREVKIYRNGAWIYCDAFTEEERAEHEEWARKFLNAQKRSDTRQHQEPA